MKYNVWIGGVCNTFNNKKDAMKEYKHWIDKGYNDVILTKDGIIDFIGNQSFYEKLNLSYEHFEKKWGSGVNDVYFLQLSYP